MSGQSSYRNGSHSHSYYTSHTSTSPTDPGQIYGSTRDMGPPPPLDFPPRPMEIDLNSNNLNSSRTLPSPSASAPAAWDSSLLQNHGYGDVPYGSSNMAKLQQIPLEGQVRPPQQNPLVQWYTGNDGPWVPRDIMDVASDERSQLRHTGNRNTMSYGSQYRQSSHTEGGPFPFGVPSSDSGYGTRQSIGNTSVFSGDVNERDPDSQSLIGHGTDYQPYQSFNEILQANTRDGRTSDSWVTPTPSVSPQSSSTLVCQTCHKRVKTQSELKKHDLRHRKPFVCKVQGCKRIQGFSTTNDLERHTKSKHPLAIPESASTKKFRCLVPGCKSKDKSWPRLDNFRSHLRRVHQQHLRNEEDFDNIIRRGEFWERSILDIDQEFSLPRSDPENPRAARPTFSDSLTRHGNPDWRHPYPEVVRSSQDLIPRTGSVLENPVYKSPSQQERSPLAQVQQETVKPLEVFRPHGRTHESRAPLDTVLAPAGSTDSAITKADHASPQPAFISKGKAVRHIGVSASDATITEVVKTALAVANIPDTSSDRAPHHGSERNELPNGKISPHSSWSAGLDPVMPATITGTQALNNREGSPASGEDLRDSQAEKKALTLEVLKTIRDLGFIVQKDPSHSPKVQNTGSVASNKSENQVTCPTCKKFKGRPCELKKHMKRHSRPYGCTFLTCNKIFGSKNDWKRHENSQHFHLETWRCDEERPEGGACAKVCYRRQTFQDHLKTHHQMSDNDIIKAKLEDCRIGRNCQARFWCGFCVKLVDLKKKGLDAWTERFDHIDDHFMGRHELPKQDIRNWVPVNSDKPRGDVDSPHSLDASPAKGTLDSSDHSGSGSSSGSSPESAVAPGGSSTDAIILDAMDGERPKKRKESSDEVNSRPSKHAKTVGTETIYCCQCKFPHNRKLEQRCNACEDAHEFCNNCTFEEEP